MATYTYTPELARGVSGVPVITSRYTYDVLASYVNDEAVCIECRPDTGHGPVITADTEIDYPEHCVRCQSLIDCRLTDEGMSYVRAEFSRQRNKVTRTWRIVFDYAWPHDPDREYITLLAREQA